MTATDSADTDGEMVYQTTVTSIGEQVPAFVAAGILILFADTAPEELHAISVLHQVDAQESGPQPGDSIEIAGTTIPVLAVGHVVADNLLNLGHMDLKSDGRHQVKLPGDVCVPVGSLVEPKVGDTIRIRRRVPTGAETGASA